MKTEHVNFKVVKINDNKWRVPLVTRFSWLPLFVWLMRWRVWWSKVPPVCGKLQLKSYVLKPSSYLEKGSTGNFKLKKTRQYFYQCQQQIFTGGETLLWFCSLCLWSWWESKAGVTENFSQWRSLESCGTKANQFLEEMHFTRGTWKVVHKVSQRGTNSNWCSLLLQSSNKWAHYKLWKPKMSIWLISSLILGHEQYSQIVVLPKL